MGITEEELAEVGQVVSATSAGVINAAMRKASMKSEPEGDGPKLSRMV